MYPFRCTTEIFQTAKFSTGRSRVNLEQSSTAVLLRPHTTLVILRKMTYSEPYLPRLTDNSFHIIQLIIQGPGLVYLLGSAPL
jgi:hypothetical protein